MSRILWHSNAPWVNTGYGAQTRLFAPRIRGLGHEVAFSAFHGLQGAVFNFDRMPVFPCADNNYGNRLLAPIADHWESDLVITLMDVWVLTSSAIEDLPLACWVPVDHEPAPPRVVKFFERTKAKPIAMSRFGERMLKDAGFDPLYVPHGTDTRVMRPRPDARAKTRARIGFPEDGFVVGMVANNKGTTPPRKAFPQVLLAFKEFQKDRPDAYLWLHSDPVGWDGGLQLAQLAEQMDLPSEAVRFTNPLQLDLGIPDKDMAEIYSAFDVLANPSYGEGFGVPILEAQACGTPVIVTDCTSMTELCGDGWTVGGDPWFNAPQKSFYRCPSVREITGAMVEAYEDREWPSKTAVDFAQDYDVERIMKKYWVPALARLGMTTLELAAA